MKERFKQYALANIERPRTFYEYFVTGSGVFPFDMMRYDHCWPATGEDAAKLEWERMGSERSRKLRSIKMHSYNEPTIDRWSSFTWSVGTEKLENTNA
jgi:hypothetical protein